MRTLFAIVLVTPVALLGCGSSSNAGKTNQAADSVGGVSLAQAQANCSSCDPGAPCLVECLDNAQTHCSQSCSIYGGECTQECGTAAYNGPYLMCAGNSGTCIPFPDPAEPGCSSYVYAVTAENCGFCATNCASCSPQLACTCADGTTPNLAVDPQNCGGCGNVCSSGTCADYACTGN